jgi:hypothetical protein
MKDLNDEYFVLEPENSDDYPLISASLKPKSIGKKVNGDYELKIYLRDPIPSNPIYVDFHTSGSMPVVSKKFRDLMGELEIEGVQVLKGSHGDVVNDLKMDYYLLHIYSRLECLDKENSDIDESDVRVSDVRSFTLDSEKLKRIPEEQRLVFKVREYGVIQLFHQSIVDILVSSGLKGFRFIPVKEWNDNVAFN